MIVTAEVIAEVIYVLKGVYGIKRDEITYIMKNFLELVNYSSFDVINLAIDTFGKENLDFVDCILYAYNKVEGMEIATFDKKLINL